MDVYIDNQFASYYRQSPLTLVDIGARGGLQSNWLAAKEHLRTIGFEPDPEEFARLAGSADGSTKYLNAALHERRSMVSLSITRSEGASSLFSPNREFLDRFPESSRFDILRTVELEADTLQNQLADNNIDDVDFIKVDTQGSELAILKGAGVTLDQSVFGLEIEVEFSPIYEGQPVFADIDAFVREHDFMLFDLSPHYWKRERGRRLGGPKGQMIFADALYLKTAVGFAKILDAQADDQARRAKLLKALSVCILYGYLDYAFEIFEDHRDLLAAGEAETFVRQIDKAVALKTKIPDFAGKGRLAGLFYSVYKLLYPTYRGWASGDKTIGNSE